MKGNQRRTVPMREIVLSRRLLRTTIPILVLHLTQLLPRWRAAALAPELLLWLVSGNLLSKFVKSVG